MSELIVTQDRLKWRVPNASLILLLFGALAIIAPTMIDVARLTWTTEQGGHAPIILATGGWLLWRELKGQQLKAEPPNMLLGLGLLGTLLILYYLARVTGILEIEAFAMYACVVAVLYLLVGMRTVAMLWFPIFYLAFAMPPPDTVVAAITQPIKIEISQLAVNFLHALGYPVASSGVMIQIANFQLLVAAACAGLNSIITLSAICLFYVYLRHRSDWRAFLVVALSILPIAVFSNFVRVLVLILVTYYLGEAAAQGFLHDFAGLTLFAVALATVFGVDSLYTRLRDARAEERS